MSKELKELKSRAYDLSILSQRIRMELEEINAKIMDAESSKLDTPVEKEYENLNKNIKEENK